MRAFVATIDVRDSRSRSADTVDRWVSDLNAELRDSLLRPFTVTAGDEFQAVTRDPALVVRLALEAVEHRQWWVGLGVGEVEAPLPAAANAGRGEAFYRARDAVQAAKTAPEGVVFEGSAPMDAALAGLLFVVGRRSTAQFETVDLARRGVRQTDIAQELAVSQQAVSKRLAAAGWHVEQRMIELCMWLGEQAVAA